MLVNGLMKCTTCGESKPLSGFKRRKSVSDGHRKQCKECMKKVAAKWPKPSKEKSREHSRRHYYKHQEKEIQRSSSVNRSRKDAIRDKRYQKEYGITLEDFEAMRAAQGGVCACCGDEEKSIHRKGAAINLHVDHCHDTGKVRGLLCTRCNIGIGFLMNDVEIMLKAAIYIEKNK